MPVERIVSIGFLTERDLKILGKGFERHFPVPQDDMFADLIRRLDEVEIRAQTDGIILRASASGQGDP